MNALRHICGAGAGLGLRLPREKRRDKAFILLYHQGHENYKQYQRDAVHG